MYVVCMAHMHVTAGKEESANMSGMGLQGYMACSMCTSGANAMHLWKRPSMAMVDSEPCCSERKHAGVVQTRKARARSQQMLYVTPSVFELHRSSFGT